MTETRRILIIDDEAPIRRFLRVALEAEGHVVIEAATASQGIAATARESPALVILDLGLPDADGIDVLREIRVWSQVPVLVLSVRSDEAGKVSALDAGAQDYVVKPFGMKELLARSRSLLRDRATGQGSAAIDIGDLRIDAANHTVMQAAAPDPPGIRPDLDPGRQSRSAFDPWHDPEIDLGPCAYRRQPVSAGLYSPASPETGR